MSVRKRKEKTHSDRPSAAERDARVLAFHQNEWEQISVRDPYLRSLRLLIARFDLAKYLLDTYPPDSVRNSPNTVPACLQVIAEARTNERFTAWSLHQQVLTALDEAVRMGGPNAFWYDLKSWEQQGMRARTTLKNGILSCAEVFYLRALHAGPNATLTPKPVFIQKVHHSFEVLLKTYQSDLHGDMQDFLQATFQKLLITQMR